MKMLLFTVILFAVPLIIFLNGPSIFLSLCIIISDLRDSVLFHIQIALRDWRDLKRDYNFLRGERRPFREEFSELFTKKSDNLENRKHS